MKEVYRLRPEEPPRDDEKHSNIEAEQQVLGALLNTNDLFFSVDGFLREEHFFDAVHQRIYKSIVSRIRKNHLATPISIKDDFTGDEGLKELGGPRYLVNLLGAAIQINHIKAYAKIVVGLAAARKVKQIAEKAILEIDDNQSAHEVQARLAMAVVSLPEGEGESSAISMAKAVTQAAEGVAAAANGERVFLKTGIEAVDKIIKGLGVGDYCLIGGATSMGKTSLAVAIAKNVAEAGKKVAFWSLEMEPDQLAARIVSAYSRVPYASMRDPSDVDEGEIQKWMKATPKAFALPITIIPKWIRDIGAGMSAAQRAKRAFGGQLDLLIVDYAQLIRGTGKTRFEQMTEVSISLKTMAGLLGCPIIALVQLARPDQNRADKRPHLSDIKESGQFENDADQALFVFREFYYLEREGPKVNRDGQVTTDARADFEAELARTRNLMQIFVRKNRHGTIGVAEIGCHVPTNQVWRLGHEGGDNGGF